VSTLALRGAASYDRHMTRRAVRTIWVLTGLCLVAGVIVSASLWVGAPDRPWQHAMKELSTLLDVVALLLWMGIFAIYWARRRPRP
jgi:Na+-transporting NADH:ubiquinone oxidoreductase subunit NqrC